MGKSKHASFSSIDKPNFQHLRAKFRGNSLKKKLRDNEANGGNSDAEEKEKKRFWCKWLGFVRKRWSNTESCSSETNADIVIRQSPETNGDVKVTSHTSSVDIIEIPIDPGKKISKILIKPTKTGIKAVIARYERPSKYGKRSQENVLVPDNARQVGDGKEKVDEQLVKTDEKRLNWNADALSEVSKNAEPLLTSALFIRQDLDKIVESAVFIEPNLPRDYADLITSEEMSQKSPKSNRRRVSYRLTDERNDPIVKTFKTASEPTCKERKKIIQHQRLKDNINNLINQFMFLEADDLLDFSVSQNATDGKKRIQCSSLNSKTPLLRQLSREVSPEILVNIKPFKEYVSNDYMNMESSSAVKIIKNQIYKDEDSIKSKHTITLKEAAAASHNSPDPCLCICPVLKSSPTFVERKRTEESIGTMTQSILSFPTTEKEIKNICYDYLSEDPSDWGSVTLNEDQIKPTIPSCTVWGVYKTYSTSENKAVENGTEEVVDKKRKEIVEEVVEKRREETVEEVVEKRREEEEEEVEEEVVEKRREETVEYSTVKEEIVNDLVVKGEKLQLCRKSLEDVFATFDDANHDAVFQKNLAQFRKKINVIPRFDLRKPVSNQMKYMQDRVVQKKVRKTQYHFQVAKPMRRGVANVAKITIGNLRENKIEKFRFECLELNNRQKAQRILENIYLLLSDAKLLSRTLSTRIEARTVSFLQTFREVYDIMENNNATVLEMVIPKSFQENLVKITLIRTESRKALTWSGRLSSDAADHGSISSVVPIYDFSRNEIESESSSSFLDTDECCYMSQDLVSFPDFEHTDASTQDITSKELIRTSTETIIKAVDSIETGNSPKIENVLIFHLVFVGTQSVVQILNDPYFDYAAKIYENVLLTRQISIKNLSDSALIRRSLNHEKKSFSDSAIASVENFISVEAMVNLNEKTISMMDEKHVNFGFDGFQILYNNSKENLYDEDEITKPTFGRRLAGRDPGFIIENIYKEEEEEEGEEGEEEEGETEEEEEEEEEQKDKLKKKNVQSLNEDTTESADKRARNLLKFKSNSSPRENIIHTEYCVHEHRFKRSFILSKDVEKDIKKRRFHLGKGIDIRRTGSATTGNYNLYSRQSRKFGIEDTFRNLILPDELKSILASENKGEGNKKIFVVDKSGANVNKELVVAAFNSIKEFNTCKGEGKDGGKRMSLVIMLSKK